MGPRRGNGLAGSGIFLASLLLAAEPSWAAGLPGFDPLAYLRRYTGELPPSMSISPEWYQKFSYHHGQPGAHHGRRFWYREGRHHGFPYGHSPYQPRAAGASYTFGAWYPRQSYYFPYSPGFHYGPYGNSVEPYYGYGFEH